MKKSESKKIFGRALICGFVITALAAFFPFAAVSAQLPQNVLRLHVVANSDSSEDQKIKLKVRDAVLLEAAKWYDGAETMEEANFKVCTNLEAIMSAANRTLEGERVGYEASAQVTDMYFTTRNYENFSLPAGKYRTLKVTLGEGEGENWWCVVFPALCLPAAEKREENLLSALPAEEQKIVENRDELKVKFKVVEIYEEMRSWFDR